MDWLAFAIIAFIPATIIHCYGRTAQWARIWRTIRYGAPSTRYGSTGGDARSDEHIELVPPGPGARADLDFGKVVPSTSPRAAGPSVTARNGHALAED